MQQQQREVVMLMWEQWVVLAVISVIMAIAWIVDDEPH